MSLIKNFIYLNRPQICKQHLNLHYSLVYLYTYSTPIDSIMSILLLFYFIKKNTRYWIAVSDNICVYVVPITFLLKFESHSGIFFLFIVLIKKGNGNNKTSFSSSCIKREQHDMPVKIILP